MALPRGVDFARGLDRLAGSNPLVLLSRHPDFIISEFDRCSDCVLCSRDRIAVDPNCASLAMVVDRL